MSRQNFREGITLFNKNFWFTQKIIIIIDTFFCFKVTFFFNFMKDHDNFYSLSLGPNVYVASATVTQEQGEKINL